MIFVDTGIWFAATIADDPNHSIAATLLREADEELVTTDYVIDETLTLMKARGRGTAAIALGDRFFAGDIVRVHYVESGDFERAWKIFRRFADKEWSFTDCVSKAVMEQLGIVTAFALDHHFKQFGIATVRP